MAYTGMRRGEALALHWDHVDLDDGTVRIRRAVSDVGHGPVYDAPKYGEGRTITAPPVVRQALREWRKTVAAEQLAAGPAWPDTAGLEFVMDSGRPIAPSYATKAFGAAVAAAELPRITLHGLRHTCATLLLRDGHSVHLVTKLLGHRDISVTLNTYAHAIPGDDSVLGDAMQRFVSG